jgi:hypothetical protein
MADIVIAKYLQKQFGKQQEKRSYFENKSKRRNFKLAWIEWYGCCTLSR